MILPTPFNQNSLNCLTKMFPTVFALIATVTGLVIGSMEIAPGICQVDQLIDGIIVTEIRECIPGEES